MTTTTPPTGAHVDAAQAAYHRDPLLSVIPAAGTPWTEAICWGPLPGPHGPCTVQSAWDVDPRHNDGDERSWTLFRGWCTCGWTGPARGEEHAAAVDLANHAWPGWWDQPTVPSPRQQAPSKRGKKKAAPAEVLDLEHRTVLRTKICPDHSDPPGLCRGCVPLTHASVLELCTNPAHYDLDAAAAYRAEVDRQRAEREARRAAAWQAVQDHLDAAAGRPVRYPADGPPHSRCRDGQHGFCWAPGCPCPCHHPDLAQACKEAKALFMRMIDSSLPPPPVAPPPAKPQGGQLTLF